MFQKKIKHKQRYRAKRIVQRQLGCQSRLKGDAGSGSYESKSKVEWCTLVQWLKWLLLLFIEHILRSRGYARGVTCFVATLWSWYCPSIALGRLAKRHQLKWLCTHRGGMSQLDFKPRSGWPPADLLCCLMETTFPLGRPLCGLGDLTVFKAPCLGILSPPHASGFVIL